MEESKNLNFMSFRPYFKDFILFLNINNGPFIIISAGIGNFIESFLKGHNCYYDNIYILVVIKYYLMKMVSLLGLIKILFIVITKMKYLFPMIF